MYMDHGSWSTFRCICDLVSRLSRLSIWIQVSYARIKLCQILGLSLLTEPEFIGTWCFIIIVCFRKSMNTMARNASANVDILYQYTIDEIRLRLISDLQDNYKIYIMSYSVLPSMEEAKV